MERREQTPEGGGATRGESAGFPRGEVRGEQSIPLPPTLNRTPSNVGQMPQSNGDDMMQGEGNTQSQQNGGVTQGTFPTTGTGYLVVQVTTASSAIPLEGAFVTVSTDTENENDVIFELRTDRDGKTERVALPAPARSTSQQPENSRPFSTYTVSVSLIGYESAIYNSVPIFDGITAIQQADLIPVPDNRYPDGFTQKRPNLFENTPPQL